MKTTNIEIYNFLNLTSHRFGRLYKYAGYSPLPKNFEITDKKIEEKLFLFQLKNEEIFPAFCNEEKGKIKKYFKNSLKNCKKIKKHLFGMKEFSAEFLQLIEIYFDMRIELTQMLLKEFKNHAFDEVAAYREIYNINPVMAPFFECLFDEKVDFESLFFDFEKRYQNSYLKKIQALEKKANRKLQKKAEEASSKNIALSETEKQIKGAKVDKSLDKTAKNAKKLENRKQIVATKNEIKKPRYGKNKEK